MDPTHFSAQLSSALTAKSAEAARFCLQPQPQRRRLNRVPAPSSKSASARRATAAEAATHTDATAALASRPPTPLTHRRTNARPLHLHLSRLVPLVERVQRVASTPTRSASSLLRPQSVAGQDDRGHRERGSAAIGVDRPLPLAGVRCAFGHRLSLRCAAAADAITAELIPHPSPSVAPAPPTQPTTPHATAHTDHAAYTPR